MNVSEIVIAFVYCFHFTKRDYHRFGCEYFEECGYKVKIYQIENPRIPSFDLGERLYRGNNREFLKWDEFVNAVKLEKQKVLYVVLDGLRYFPFLRVFKRYRSSYVLAGMLAPFPSTRENGDSGLPRSSRDILKEYLWNVSLGNYFRLKKWYQELLIKKNPPWFVFTSTEYSDKDLLPFVRKCRIIRVPTDNCNVYIENSRRQCDEKECIVFCSSGFGFIDEDTSLLGIDDGVYKNRRHYIALLNELFSILERDYGCEVCILGHPHTIYDDAFGNREVIFGKTCQMVQNAKLFIYEMTTAVAFPILYNVPMLAVRDNSFWNNDVYSEYIYGFMQALGIPKIMNLDSGMQYKDYIYVTNQEKRIEIIDKYINDSGNFEETGYEILEREVRGVCGELDACSF